MTPRIGDEVVDIDTNMTGKLVSICPSGEGRVETEHGVLFTPFHRLQLAEGARIRRALRTFGEFMTLVGIFAVGVEILIFGRGWGM